MVDELRVSKKLINSWTFEIATALRASQRLI